MEQQLLQGNQVVDENFVGGVARQGLAEIAALKDGRVAQGLLVAPGNHQRNDQAAADDQNGHGHQELVSEQDRPHDGSGAFPLSACFMVTMGAYQSSG